MAVNHQLDDIAVLARSSLLRGLSARELGELLPYLTPIDVAAGERVDAAPLRASGDQLPTALRHVAICVIVSGSVHVVAGPEHGRAVYAGDSFGEPQFAALLADVEPTSAVALAAVRAVLFSRSDYAALQQSHPQLAFALADAVLRQLALREMEAAQQRGLLAARDSLRAIDRLGSAGRADVLVAARVDQRLVSLDALVSPEQEITPITTHSPEGRHVFRQSAGLLLLRAAAESGFTEVRLGPSIRSGQVIELNSATPNPATPNPATLLINAFDELIEADVALSVEHWRVEQAIEHFAQRGWQGAASLLQMSPDLSVELLASGEVRALGPGPLVPSSRTLRGVTLLPHPQGLFLDFGPAIRRTLSARPQSTLLMERRAPRYGAPMTQRQNQWLEMMNVPDVGRFNECCISGRVNELIFVSEGFHERNIAHAADAIGARSGVRAVLVAGPSASGKTTFIQRLKIQLEVNGLRPLVISLDDYYREPEHVPRDAEGRLNYDVIESLDLDLFGNHVRRLLAGEGVRTAHYDFRRAKLTPDGGAELCLSANHVLLVEGIFGLNPQLLPEVDDELLFRIFIQPALSLPFDRLSRLDPSDVRLVRRIVRDRHHRGFLAADNLARWPTVLSGERQAIFPYQELADFVFDSSLIYEPSVTRVFAERYLLEVPRGHPQYDAARRLRLLLQRFVPIHPDSVPPTSILREFIGGSGFSYG